MTQATTNRPLAQLLKWPAEGVSRVPMRVYTDPEIYGWEQDLIFRGAAWHFLCLESEVVARGDYITTHVGDTSVVVVRSATGQINAMVNKCAHKGTTLCYRRNGTMRNFTCPYHNWIYDYEGKLTSVAFERGIDRQGGMPAGFDKSKHSLKRLRIECLNGLVFGTVSDETPPLEEFLGAEMTGHIRRTLRGPLKVLGRYTQLLSNNWKLHMENTRDTYHPSLLHSFFATFRLNRLSAQGGIMMDARRWHHVSFVKRHTDSENAEYSSGSVRAVKNDFGLADPSLLDQWIEYPDGMTNSILTMFPGFVLFQVSNCLGVRQIVPRGPEECEIVWTLLGFEDDTEQQTAMRVKQANLVGPAGYISMEDGIIGSFVHRGIKGDLDGTVVLEMGADGEEGQTRATEVTVRTFWQAYREMMGV